MKAAFTLLFIAFSAWNAQAETAAEYGAQCAKEVTPVPAFNCMSGEVIPITVNGKTPSAYTPGMTCDRPSLLTPLPPGSQGQCVPGTRALVLRDDPTAQISAICRKYVVRDISSPLFDEIDIVAHNLKNGKTCWFKAAAPVPVSAGTGIDGRAIPSPTSLTTKLKNVSKAELEMLWAGQAQNGNTNGNTSGNTKESWAVDVSEKIQVPHTFWWPPAAVARDKCVNCHDSGPFMYSPYIAQTTQLPSDPFGRYLPKAVGKDFASWPQPFGITTRGNTCTTCHNMGNLNSCNVATWQATGQMSQTGGNDWSKQFPQSHWMSPGNLHSQLQWDQAFQTSLAKIAACCQNPKGAECQQVDYTAPGLTLKPQNQLKKAVFQAKNK